MVVGTKVKRFYEVVIMESHVRNVIVPAEHLSRRSAIARARASKDVVTETRETANLYYEIDGVQYFGYTRAQAEKFHKERLDEGDVPKPGTRWVRWG
jgi:hypothetical protein